MVTVKVEQELENLGTLISWIKEQLKSSKCFSCWVLILEADLKGSATC